MLKIVAIIIIAVISCSEKTQKEGHLVINNILYIIINPIHCREVHYESPYIKDKLISRMNPHSNKHYWRYNYMYYCSMIHPLDTQFSTPTEQRLTYQVIVK